MHLYLQCPTGISGDMFLGAMADLGLDLAPLSRILDQAGVEGQIHYGPDVRCGLQGVTVDVQVQHEHRALRTLDEIRPLVQESSFSAAVKNRSMRAFERLAQVEARVHGLAVADVHFHEVGAVDTLVDILGCFWALEALQIDSVSCSALPWFQGRVKCTHGILPLPAPATVRLLQGKPVVPTDFEQELITPTGALIVDQIVSRFGSAPAGTLLRSGTGWGQTDLSPTPNGLRVFLFPGDAPGQGGEEVERIMVLESALDHLTGEEVGALFSPLFAAGALDVLYLPGVMKKNRPGGMLQVLCRPEDLPRVQTCFIDQTMTLGLRRREVERVILPRKTGTARTAWGSVQSKSATWQGETWTKPEFEAVQSLARKTGRSPVQLRYLLQDLDCQDSDSQNVDDEERIRRKR